MGNLGKSIRPLRDKTDIKTPLKGVSPISTKDLFPKVDQNASWKKKPNNFIKYV